MHERLRESVEVLLQFDATYSRHVAPLHDAVLALGFNRTELRVFFDLGASRGGSTASWLGRGIALEKSHLSHILRSFRDHGHTREIREDHDHRLKRIELTDAGRRLFLGVDRRTRDEAYALLSCYDEQDRLYIARSMRALGLILEHRRR